MNAPPVPAFPAPTWKGRIHAYLELVRIPNVFTALADIAAGYFYVHADAQGTAALPFLLGASACLYSGGMALNDAADAELDRVERTGRPIPSGRISRLAAYRLSGILLGCGVLLASCASLRSSGIALVLTAAIVIYDCVLKKSPLSPAVMGLCRALNLSLGMSGGKVVWDSGAVLIPLGLMACYVASFTEFARHEAAGSSAKRLTRSSMGALAAVLVLGTLPLVHDPVHGEYLIFVVGLAGLVATAGFRAARAPEPSHVQRAVAAYIGGLILFDAAIVAATRGLPVASIVLAAYVPTLILKKHFRMT